MSSINQTHLLVLTSLRVRYFTSSKVFLKVVVTSSILQLTATHLGLKPLINGSMFYNC